jgi:thiamine-phosphate pyrophosphorylase
LAERLRRDTELKLFLHDDDQLARELGIAGVHFSGRGAVRLERALDAGLFTVVSTHSLEEAKAMEERGVHAVTLSPIFPSPGKGVPLGIDLLTKAVRELKIPVIALGGIVTEETVNVVRESGAFGFASIRYFAAD